MQYEAIQSIFDSLCQCLGSPTIPPEDKDDMSISCEKGTAALLDKSSNTSGSRSPATRRTHRLALQDKQWDALFDSVSPDINNNNNNKLLQQPQLTHRHGGSPDSGPDGGGGSNTEGTTATGVQPDMETAQALAEAKQAANPSRYNLRDAAAAAKPKSHKRKRPRPSRDDIFRSRKMGAGASGAARRTPCGGDGESACLNPISKFLSNHQGFANALCFATPVRDEEEEDEEDADDDIKDEDRHDNNSLASEANTLNTCEDSMLLLDRKLAQMSQNQPPMPLFHDFKVNQNDGEGLRRIVNNDAHSSTNLMRLWKDSHNSNNHHHQQQQQQSETNEPMDIDRNVTSSSSASSTTSGGYHGHGHVRQAQQRAATAAVRHQPPVIQEEDVLPPMEKSMTSSSSDSSRSRPRRRQRGEI